MIVAFLGPDGVGKSTLISAFSASVKEQFHTDYYYLLPGWLPRYRNIVNGQAVTNPHDKVSHNTILSIIKLIFWIIEYFGGYLFKVNKSPRTISIFDRYYYDILVDPHRYCYSAPISIAKFFGLFIPKPDLIVILDAPTDVIQSRKQEVSFEETERQRKKYLSLAKRYTNSVVINTTQDIELSLNDLIKAISNE